MEKLHYIWNKQPKNIQLYWFYDKYFLGLLLLLILNQLNLGQNLKQNRQKSYYIILVLNTRREFKISIVNNCTFLHLVIEVQNLLKKTLTPLLKVNILFYDKTAMLIKQLYVTDQVYIRSFKPYSSLSIRERIWPVLVQIKKLQQFVHAQTIGHMLKYTQTFVYIDKYVCLLWVTIFKKKQQKRKLKRYIVVFIESLPF